MQLEQQVVEIAGVATRYVSVGSGPLLIFLHGIGDNAADWQWVLPQLADHYQVCALDLPGFSGLGARLPDYSLDFFTQYVLAFLTTLQAEQAVVIGNSLGGLIALQLALIAPSRVRALVLVDSAGLGRAINPALCALAYPVFGDVATAWATSALGAAQRVAFRTPLLFAHPARVPQAWFVEQYRLSRRPYFLINTLAALRARLTLSGQRTVLVDQLPAVQAPTLILWGKRDRIVPYTQAQRAIQRVATGNLVLLPDCGHLPHVEQPERFVREVREFLRKHLA